MSYVSFLLNVFIGQNSYSELFKMFKEIHMVSFQCSPLATSDGIIGTFRQCQKYQMKKDLSKLTAVVILDEVGLAEDSPKMPLKALHPLLEDGCIEDEEPTEDRVKTTDKSFLHRFIEVRIHFTPD